MHRSLSNLSVVSANNLLIASCLKSYWAFGRAARNTESTQRLLLLDLVRRARSTQFGVEHGFHRIRSIDEFRSRVPIRVYTDYSHYVDAIVQGRKNVLAADPVLLLQPSSGSTSATKLIPFTARLREEFMRGVKPWLANLYLSRKRLLSGRAYWAITPAGNSASKSDGAVPVGFDEDSGYFGSFDRFLLKRSLAVPDEVAAIADVPSFQYVTLLCLLRQRNLAFASVWNPTFLTLLLRSLEPWFDALLRDVRAGTITPPHPMPGPLHRTLTRRLRPDRQRAEELAGVLGRLPEEERFVRIWPRLQLVSCWCDGNASRSVPDLRRMLPGVEIQPKGLMATEGIVSFPLVGRPGSALAVRSHFFEFIRRGSTVHNADLSGCQTLLAHELEQGGRYGVILTTGGGLYRYYLGDLIEVVGFDGQLPLLRFVAKEDDVSDVAGEKLHAAHVERVLEAAWGRFAAAPEFQMLAPHRAPVEPPCYVLYVQKAHLGEQLLGGLASEIDSALRENFHYNHCRNLGQLGPLRLFVVGDDECPANERRLAHLAALGRKLGTVKPSVLEKNDGWSGVFVGRFLSFPVVATGGQS
ncbi:MAG: GH3 auxin-responsive promoter family protein [Candidatus Nealsonbacteria bacterium]|nr:GH3 auxin-responsive promoter family protein [Candidatus Nealsonbacteria bacterium]